MAVKRKNRDGKVQTGAWLDEKIYKKAQILAIKEGLTVGLLMENALREYLSKHKKKL